MEYEYWQFYKSNIVDENKNERKIGIKKCIKRTRKGKIRLVARLLEEERRQVTTASYWSALVQQTTIQKEKKKKEEDVIINSKSTPQSTKTTVIKKPKVNAKYIILKK